MHRFAIRAFAPLALLLASAACTAPSSSPSDGGDGDVQMPRSGAVGAPCTRNADCDSQLCLAAGRCTEPCQVTTDCPSSWTCDAIPNAGTLCNCMPSGRETCDGVDNDCDGFVDNGATCDGSHVCMNGMCACAPDHMCGSTCADFQNDHDNCGGCGHACDQDHVCQDGMCVTHCHEGTELCGGQCVDTTMDANNCGACGHACGAQHRCDVGTCVLDCGPLAECGSSCVDTNTDASNCGDCGIACPSGQVCSVGTCLDRCPGTQVRCGTNCVDTTSDVNNCGACGHTCGGLPCVGGTCACPSGQTACGSHCADLQTDDTNCGSCGSTCTGGAHCVSGACVHARVPGATCTTDADCGTGGACIVSAMGWSGGYCVYPGCRSDSDCPSGGVCPPFGNEQGLCMAHCTNDGDCRSGYRCEFPSVSLPGYCVPDCSSNPALLCGAAACDTSTGQCETVCSISFGCSDGSLCASDGTCICTSSTDCGPNSVCNDSTGACGCANDTYCGPGHHCDLSTGLCS